MNSESKNIYLYYGRLIENGLSSWKKETKIVTKIKMLKSSGLSTFKISNHHKYGEETLQGLIAVSFFLKDGEIDITKRFFIKFFQEDFKQYSVKKEKTQADMPIKFINDLHYDLKIQKKECFEGFCKFMAQNIRGNEVDRVKEIKTDDMFNHMKNIYKKEKELQLADSFKKDLKKIINKQEDKNKKKKEEERKKQEKKEKNKKKKKQKQALKKETT